MTRSKPITPEQQAKAIAQANAEFNNYINQLIALKGIKARR